MSAFIRNVFYWIKVLTPVPSDDTGDEIFEFFEFEFSEFSFDKFNSRLCGLKCFRSSGLGRDGRLGTAGRTFGSRPCDFLGADWFSSKFVLLAFDWFEQDLLRSRRLRNRAAMSSASSCTSRTFWTCLDWFCTSGFLAAFVFSDDLIGWSSWVLRLRRWRLRSLDAWKRDSWISIDVRRFCSPSGRSGSSFTTSGGDVRPPWPEARLGLDPDCPFDDTREPFLKLSKREHMMKSWHEILKISKKKCLDNLIQHFRPNCWFSGYFVFVY